MYEKYFKQLKEECLIRNRSSRTAEAYISNIKSFMSWTGNKTMQELSLQDARDFILFKRKNGVAASTCNFYNSSLCFLYKHVLHIPWDQELVPRMRIDARLPEVLSLDEVETLITTASHIRNKAIIALLYSSGLRVGELVNLRAEDIYMSKMQVYIPKSKNHRDRWTILSNRALELLTEYWKSYPAKRENFFVSLDAPHEPLKVSGVEIMLRAVGKDAGLSAHPHTLRHSFASHMIEQGVPINYVQSMLGHRCLESTQVYIHISNKTVMGIKSPLDHPQKKNAVASQRKKMVISMNNQITIQDVFHQFLPQYSETQLFSEQQHMTALCISKCRTAQMGANVSKCESCHKQFIHYNSCKNRHCPMCQGMDVDEWIDKQQENVLDVPYFHTVFTIPEELYPLVYSNQKLLYDALYHAAHLAMTELSSDPKHLGAKTGYICVLHTWGSRMNYHPHLHMIVLGGGLDSSNRWKDKGQKFFFPVKIMSAVFKKHYLKELKLLRESEKLQYYGTSVKLRNYYAFKELLNKLYAKEWITYTKEAFNGANSVIKYLGKYTHRIAISNSRIISMTGETVTYLAKDYKNGGKMIPYTVKGTEFLRMFLMHVLPKGFVRIRHYGILSCRSKKEKMDLCRKLLNCTQYLSQLRNKTTAEKLLILYGKDICKCEACGGKLISSRLRGNYSLTG